MSTQSPIYIGNSLSERLILVTRRYAAHIIVLAIVLMWSTPTVGLFITSLRPSSDIATSGWWTILNDLDSLTLDNYALVLNSGDAVATPINLTQNFVNSVLITVPGVILPVLIGALAAYGFAWLQFPFRKWLYLGVVALLVVPLQVTWVPVLSLYNQTGLANSYPGIWLAHTGYGLAFATFLLYNFVVDLPVELIESAKIDGATEFGVFFRIILPLTMPAIASLSVFQFVWVWNNLMNALLYLPDVDKAPLPVALRSLIGEYGSAWHILSASAFVMMALPMMVFFAFQKYFVQGVTAGAVKG